MDRIIAGRFQTRLATDRVVAMMGGYVPRKDFHIFQNHQPGRQDAMQMNSAGVVEPAGMAAVEWTVGCGHAAGIILAIRVAFAGDVDRVIDDLRRGGALDIGQANALWDNGERTDFSPAAAARMVAPVPGP